MPATPTQRRTQVERRSDSEELLLAAAAELVAERGVEGASLARIGERAGTSRGLATHHFGSKDALVARLAARAQDHVFDATRAAIELTEQTPADVLGLDGLRMTVDTFLSRFEQPDANDRALIVMWGATFPSTASVEGMLTADHRSFQGWADLIERGKQDGSIRADVDAQASAVLLHGLLRGLAGISLTSGEPTVMARVRAACQEWIGLALAASG